MQLVVAVLALTGTQSLLISFSSILLEPSFAQSNTPNASFPLPQSLQSGTTVKVDGSSSMRVINEALRKRFEQKYPGTKVDLASGGSDGALAALQRGDINLAAVGRPLTDQEKAQGLEFVPLSREKIAIIVGTDNPFKQNLTFEQFVKMFRGQLLDWSQVGRAPGKIQFLDHPEWSDTRRSLSNYDIFKKAPFKNGANTTRLSSDDTATIVQALGKDGISYAIADQVLNLPSARVIPMHKTLPSDPRYPYSQLRGYVYRKQTTTPAMLAFLGFATSAPGQEIVAAAKQQEVETVRQSTNTSGTATAPTATTSQPAPNAQTALVTTTTSDASDLRFPWWLVLLLAIPLLGLLWWLLKRSRGFTSAAIVDRGNLKIANQNQEITNLVFQQIQIDLDRRIESIVNLKIANQTFHRDMQSVKAEIENFYARLEQFETQLYLRINQGDTELYNWTLEQLVALQGCLTDRQALIEQFESFSARLQTELDNAQCVNPNRFSPRVGIGTIGDK